MSGSLVELVPTRLFYMTVLSPELSPAAREGVFAAVGTTAANVVCLQEQHPRLLEYTGYHLDFGPLSLASSARLSARLGDFCRDEPEATVLLLPTGPEHQQSSANILVAIAYFAVAELGATADQLRADYLPRQVASGFACFHDASPHDDFIHLFDLTVEDVALGIHRAASLQIFQPQTFDAEEYEHFEAVENGDVNWLVPGLLLATSCPERGEEDLRLAVLRGWGAADLVQLNEADYDAGVFRAAGVAHHELVFEDGSVPEVELVAAFLGIMEQALQQGTAVAVHCKAGLGRTGTLACCFLMHAYGFGAKEAIGWCRVCRPGSVIGPQQNFLLWAEREIRMGRTFPTSAPPTNGAADAPVDVSNEGSSAPPAAVSAAPTSGGSTRRPKYFVPSPMLRRYNQ